MTAYQPPLPVERPHPTPRPKPLLTVVDADPTPPPRRRPISAIVTTFNEADSIAECLESLAWCDEILVVDSHSSDATREIAARSPGVRVLTRTYYGAASQKNWAIDRCRHEWILILDADERVTPALRTEIEEILAKPVSATAFAIPRNTHALGKRIRYSGWQHDRVTRLFHRDHARYPDRRVHADMRTLAKPVTLKSALDHRMVETVEEYAARTRRYAFWGAAQLWRDGRRDAGPWCVLVRPSWRFFRTFALQLGFLDGIRGLIMCGVPAFGAFVKYATVWSWARDLEDGRRPELPEFDEDPATWAWAGKEHVRVDTLAPDHARG